MAVRDLQVAATLVELADTLVSDYDLHEYLDRLLSRSTDVLSAEAGGVMLSDGRKGSGALQLLACTNDNTQVVEAFELQSPGCCGSSEVPAP